MSRSKTLSQINNNINHKLISSSSSVDSPQSNECFFFLFFFFPGSAFTTSDNLSLSSWVSSSSSFPGFQHPQTLTALGTSTASIATPIPHPIQGSLPPYSRLGMPLTPSAIASSMQGSGPTFPSFHMPRYHHYFQQGPYAAIQGLRHSSAVMTPFV